MTSMRSVTGTAGASLIELMASLVFVGCFAGLLHQFAQALLHGVRALELASEAQEAARIGIHLMTADLRYAGYSTGVGLGNGVRVARVDAIEVASDLTGDGDTDDAHEIVGYSVDPVAQTLRRTLGDAAPQPLLAGVAPNGVTFSYFDGAGDSVSVTGGIVTDADRQRIRRIDIVLEIAIANPGPGSGSVRAMQSASVALRNG